MATRPEHSIEDRLLAAQVAIDAALADPTLQAALAPFGYDTDTLDAGRRLYERAQALVAAQKQEYGEQFGASEAVQNAWATADTAYTRSLKLARVALKNSARAQVALGLTGSRKRTLSGWLDQAELFYRGLLANNDFQAEMARFGYDAAKIQAEADLVTAVRTANVAQEKEKGEAQEATKIRDAQMDALDEWMSDFKSVAEVALADQPQQLEKLGFGAIA